MRNKINSNKLGISISIIIAASLFTLNKANAQSRDTIYYNAKWEKTDRENKHFYRVIYREGKKKPIRVQDYYPNGIMQMDGWYSRLEPETKDGEFTWWDENGKKNRWMVFEKDEPMKITEWDSDGKITRQQERVKTVSYKNGERVSESRALEKAPVFDRGRSTFAEYLRAFLTYPDEAQGSGGKVIIRFVVDKSGKVKDAKVVQSVNAILDDAALDFIKSLPRWTPAVQEGENIDVTMELPVSFNP